MWPVFVDIHNYIKRSKLSTEHQKYYLRIMVTHQSYFFSFLFALTVSAFEVQRYLEAKGQRNKSLGGNTHLMKVNDSYHQKWALRDLR